MINKNQLKHGGIEMILVPSGVLKVMKNKSVKSELIMDICLGPNSDSWELMTQPVLEEVSKFSPEIVEIVTECFSKNMILFWTKSITNNN
jgi:hypothetical protein